jgi:hypothetical protein
METTKRLSRWRTHQQWAEMSLAARTVEWKDCTLRQLKRGWPSYWSPHRMTDRCRCLECARNRIPGGGGFFWLAPGGNIRRRPRICNCRGCLDLGTRRNDRDGEAVASRSQSRGERSSGGEKEPRSAGWRNRGSLLKHTWAATMTTWPRSGTYHGGRWP